MDYRKQLEEKILFILLTYEKEFVSDNTSMNSFDLIRKHSLSWEDFESKIHQDIFKAIQNQMQKLPRLEFSRLVEFRPADYKVFEPQQNQFLSLIVNIRNTNFASFSELEPLVYKLKEFILARFLQNMAQNIMSTNLMSVDVIAYGQSFIDNYNRLYKRITEGIIQSEDNTDQMVAELSKKVENANAGMVGDIPIRVREIQNLMYGLNAPDLIVLGARPSMGKTTTGLYLADSAADAGFDTMYVSLEMSKQQLSNIVIANRTGIPALDIRLGKLTPEQFLQVAQYYKLINNSKLNIVSSQYRWLEKLQTKARQLHKIGKLKLIVIDYLQLMKTEQKSGNRDQMLGIITGELKSLALELNVPIIALSQLKRSSAGRKPTLEDLRESGNIEQDADVVAFIHRQAFYQENYDKLPYEQQFLTEFIIRKNRLGELGTATYFQDVKKSQVYDV